MTLLNRKIDYALLILCYLHQKREGGCAREIAAHFQISRAFVANILKDLCQKDFVLSQRGMKGGYLLREAAPRHTLADLLDALDDTVRLAACNESTTEECCSLSSQCPIKGPIEDVHRRIRQVLENVTLGEIFSQPLQPPLVLEVSRCSVGEKVACELG